MAHRRCPLFVMIMAVPSGRFVYTYERSRSFKTNFRWVSEEKTELEDRRYVTFFSKSMEYTFL